MRAPGEHARLRHLWHRWQRAAGEAGQVGGGHVVTGKHREAHACGEAWVYIHQQVAVIKAQELDVCAAMQIERGGDMQGLCFQVRGDGNAHGGTSTVGSTQ